MMCCCGQRKTVAKTRECYCISLYQSVLCSLSEAGVQCQLDGTVPIAEIASGQDGATPRWLVSGNRLRYTTWGKEIAARRCHFRPSTQRPPTKRSILKPGHGKREGRREEKGHLCQAERAVGQTLSGCMRHIGWEADSLDAVDARPIPRHSSRLDEGRHGPPRCGATSASSPCTSGTLGTYQPRGYGDTTAARERERGLMNR